MCLQWTGILRTSCPNDMQQNYRVRKISSSEADNYFHHSMFRLVKNDCTVTIDNVLYEAPAKYIGKKVEIRFPLDNPEDLRIFEENKQCAVLTKLDKHYNSEFKIRYKTGEEKNV
jgi:hypothetical protein